MGPHTGNDGPSPPPTRHLMRHRAAPASPVSSGTAAGGGLQEQREAQTASKPTGKTPRTSRYGGAPEGARCQSDRTLHSGGCPPARRAPLNVSRTLGRWKRHKFAPAFALMYCVRARVSLSNYALSDDREHDTSQNGISMILTSSSLAIDLKLLTGAF